MEYSCIEVQHEAGIATITFNRPKALNALNGQTLRELAAALEDIAGNEEIRVLILTGSGEKAFVAGADITEIRQLTPLAAKKFAGLGQQTIDRCSICRFR